MYQVHAKRLNRSKRSMPMSHHANIKQVHTNTHSNRFNRYQNDCCLMPLLMCKAIKPCKPGCQQLSPARLYGTAVFAGHALLKVQLVPCHHGCPPGYARSMPYNGFIVGCLPYPAPFPPSPVLLWILPKQGITGSARLL